MLFEPESYAYDYEDEVETWQSLASEHVVDLDAYRALRPEGPVKWRRRPAQEYAEQQTAVPDEFPF